MQSKYKLFLVLGFLFFCIFYSIYGFTSYITSLHAYRWKIHFAFELHIPFLPTFSLVYLSMFAMFLFAPMILPSEREIFAFFLVLCLATAIAGLFFLAFPVVSGFPKRKPYGWAKHFFFLADTMNLNYNMLPSLHVTFAYTTAAVYAQYVNLYQNCFFCIWATLVAISTLLIHEHHLLDIFTACILSTFLVKISYARYNQQKFFDTWKKRFRSLDNS
ncbi:MAG: phosphatase PAP2 family protein [Spirochaetota bacterium]